MQYFGFDRPSFGIKTFGFGANFDPLDLFAGGKQGVWYDPSDKSTLFQDVAGTVPVTKDGDPVALMRDKSGNGNHATQTVSTARPIYKTDGILHWLNFDGVDDFLKVSLLDMSAHTDLSFFAAAQREVDRTSIIAEFSANTSNNTGSFYVVAGGDLGVDGWSSLSRGDASILFGQGAASATTAPETSVLSIHHSIPNDLSTIRRNQVAGANGIANKGLGNFGNHDLYIGARAGSSLFFNSKLYSLVVSGGLATADDVINTEKYLAAKAGVTL